MSERGPWLEGQPRAPGRKVQIQVGTGGPFNVCTEDYPEGSGGGMSCLNRGVKGEDDVGHVVGDVRGDRKETSQKAPQRIRPAEAVHERGAHSREQTAGVTKKAESTLSSKG